MKLVNLIQLLETAKIGSRELDQLICEAIAAGAPGRDNPCLWAPERMAPGGDVMEIDAATDGPRTVQPYTTSIDAAVGLLPAGWSWHIRVLYGGDARKTPNIRAAAFNNATGMVLAAEYFEAEAKSTAVALCIAALRARAILE